jgi:hypothetical protein
MNEATCERAWGSGGSLLQKNFKHRKNDPCRAPRPQRLFLSSLSLTLRFLYRGAQPKDEGKEGAKETDQNRQ